MRPDEEANRDEIQRDKNFQKNVSSAIGSAAAIGTGGAAARVIPFLSKFLTPDIAMKGLSKVSPKIADFLQRGQSMGLNVQDGLQYLRDSIEPKQESQQAQSQPAKENRNIIEQYSPNLFQYIKDLISQGNKPVEAAIKAKKFLTEGESKKAISQIEKDHKTKFEDIVQSIFGNEAVNQAPQQNVQQQPNPQDNQAGPGQQALMNILSKINQSLGQ